MRAIRLILSMKKAFSLFEMLLVVVLLGVAFVLFAKPLTNLAHFYGRQEGSKLINANSALIIIEKILQNCLEFSPLNSGFECILKDSDNLILQRANALFIGSGAVLLKDENSSIYAPKSHFIYSGKDGKNKAFNAGVLENHNDLQGAKNNEFLFFYDLKGKKIHKAKILNAEKIAFTNDEFTGFYALVEAKISLNLENGSLIYRHTPYLTGVSRKGILLENAKNFSVNLGADGFEIALCIDSANCLEKWVRR